MLGFLIKVRVVETQHFLEHDLCVAGFSFYRWKRLVSPGLWSVDCINGRFRLNRITQVGKDYPLSMASPLSSFVHEPYRT